MRQNDSDDSRVWLYVSAEQRTPADQPLRPIRRMVDEVPERLSSRLDRLFSNVDRPLTPPSGLLRA